MHPLVHSNGMGSNIPSFGYLIGSLTFIPMGLTGGLRPLQNSIVSGQWNKIGFDDSKSDIWMLCGLYVLMPT